MSTTGSSRTAGCRSTCRSSDNFPRAVAAYKDYDVLLVNAIFDGLNLVAKEAPLVNERDGVLILSENAGAHEELGDWALSINPFDVAGQADAIHEALDLPRRGATRARRGDPRAGCASTTSPRGSSCSSGARRRVTRVSACEQYELARMSELSHVSDSGDVRMVDVGGKPLSRRRAVASARVRMAAETARRLRELPKGDALVTAQLAGIMAAKRTAELIPLCHPLPLTHVDVTLEVGDGAVEIVASAETTAQTGVEMEALTAAAVAALTVYDMAKAIDKEMVVERRAARREDEGAGEGGRADGLRRRLRGRAGGPERRRCSTSCSPATASTSSGGSCPTSATRSRRRFASSPPRRGSC